MKLKAIMTIRYHDETILLLQMYRKPPKLSNVWRLHASSRTGSKLQKSPENASKNISSKELLTLVFLSIDRIIMPFVEFTEVFSNFEKTSEARNEFHWFILCSGFGPKERTPCSTTTATIAP